MRRILAGALAVVLLSAGCGDDDGGPIRIDEGDAGTTVELGSDRQLEVRLEGNPTTGFTWEIDDPGVLSLVDRSHQPESDAEGAGGISTLTFEAAAAGTADLVLVYHQVWDEQTDPAEIFSVTVSVIE